GVRPAEPVGQGGPRVFAARRVGPGRVERRAVGGLGGEGLAGQRVLDGGAGAGPDELGLAGDGGRDALALALDLAEAGGEAVEVVLAPFLVRVVVAPGAVHPNAH